MAKNVKNLLKEFKWELLTHAPCSPDLAPSDYHLFRSLSHSLDGKKIKSKDQVKIFLKNFFEKKEKEFYKRGIKNLIERWQKTIDAQGNYFD